MNSMGSNMKLWLSEKTFVEIERSEKTDLSAEVAIRSRSIDWMGLYGYLPDPDPVLIRTSNDLSVYRQLLVDAHVWTCYQSRKAATLSCEYEIRESAKGGSRTNKRAVELIEDVMDGIDIYQVITDMLEAPFYGMSPIEIVWKATAGKWIPERIEGKPPEWFRFDLDNNLRFLSRDNMIEGEAVPPMKFLLPRHHASYQNPYGERVLSRCFWPVVFKKGGLKFWAIFTEKYGMPWVVGRVPRLTNETERAQLLSKLASMVQDAVAVINDDESIDIQEFQGKSASAHIYDKLVDVSNKEVSKAILGQTATTEGTPGKLGEEKGQNETKKDIVEADKLLVKQAFDTLFRWIVALNLPDFIPPEFVWFEEEDIRADRAERDKNLTEQGVRFTPSYYKRTYNLEDSDFTVGEPPVKNPAAGPGQAPNPAPSFTEKAGVSDLSPAPTLDALGRKVAASARLDGLMKPIEELLGQAGSLEEFRDRLLEIYGDMDEGDLGALMQKAMTLADLAGAFDATER